MNEANSRPQEAPDDIELALPALKRAAEVARARARRHGSRVILWRDGRIVEESAPAASQDQPCEG